jgi:cell division protein ZapA
MSKLTIEIYGANYTITAKESPEYVLELAEELDEKLTKLMELGGLSLNQAFVLVALHYVDAHKKSEEAADHLREQVSEYLKDATTARSELTAAMQRLERYEKGGGHTAHSGGQKKR